MLDYIRSLLESDALSPHGICLLWRPELIWTHAISDAVIGLAYFSIPIVLAYFVSKRRDVGFTWVFWAFAFFILACGTTHFLSIWTLWVPDYGAEALMKAVTALASIMTAIALWPLLPRALTIPSPAQLRQANAVLQKSIRERDAALAQLRRETDERLKAEEMLRQSQKMEAVGQLTSGIAHDFNNLLTAVLGNLEIIERRTASDPHLQRIARNAVAGADRAALLTQQLLAFARKQPLKPSLVDVSEVAGRTIELIGPMLGSGIAIETVLGRDLTAQVDPHQLESALVNLALNARDAMPSGGTLAIRTRAAWQREIADLALPGQAFVVVEICDSGIGMDERVKERASEPFFTTKPVGQGTGLGLSQVHGFMAQSNGYMRIDSAPGQGTTVRLYLAASGESPRPDPKAAMLQAAPVPLRPAFS